MRQEKADAIRQRAEDLPESRKRELKLKMILDFGLREGSPISGEGLVVPHVFVS